MIATLVDPLVTREKFQREVERWKANAPRDERGWLLLSVDEEKLSVEIAFLGTISTSGGSGLLPIVACAVRLTYENYDLWPPSLTFIDPFTRQPAKPHVNALVKHGGGYRNVLIDAHPMTRLPFLCLPGIREYHNHPQHTGDDWLLHRSAGEGTLVTISDRIWQFMVVNIVGLHVSLQALPVWPAQAQLQILIAQGEFQANVASQDLESAAAPIQEIEKVA